MKTFSLSSLTAEAHSRFPEAQRRPIIGLTANHRDLDANIREAYCQQVVAAGGVPVIIPAITDTDVAINTLNTLDAIIFTGGGDYNPLWVGEQPSPKLHNINAQRDSAELLLCQLAYNRQLPMLGICRGMQTLAIALGGHVAQDLSTTVPGAFPPGTPATVPAPTTVPAVSPAGTATVPAASPAGSIKHSQDADRSEPTHTITITPDTQLAAILAPIATVPGVFPPGTPATVPAVSPAGTTLPVNSFHHQAVDNPGPHFRAVAYAPDGVIEAMESTEEKSIIGVQWHPEWLGADGLPLFQWLCQRATEYRAAIDLHSRVLTLDTHCDTPMFFHQGVNFLHRDPRILVDLHKMTEGHQDATTMVCYLPQPTTATNGGPASYAGKTFSELVHYDIESPKAYADFIFDRIADIVASCPAHLAFARNAEELYANKAAGMKSIVLGIENGHALEHDITNIAHFKERGITYITLCHNGDNDICDSAYATARGVSTHNGVSAFGEDVIREMNRLGIMVDLSHAAEKSFYDAMAISSTPIVCSHSNCRALCDHARNLTDDQLRALAKSGGVAHTTIYSGFLQKDGNATILDAISHLEHAISIMGIDHVGLGTDFDGDGGVPGLANSSELINFTIQLLRRRYSDADIQKIWGGNWLRVMSQVQACAI